MNRKRLALPLILTVMLLPMAVPALAAAGTEVTLTPDRSELTVGDPVHLTLEVTHPAGYQVIIPKLEQAWGDLEVRAQSLTTTTANDDGTATTRQTIEATLFNLGEFQTPELPLTLSDGAGQVSEEVAPPVALNVVPTLAEDDNDLRDIKPQAALAVPALWPWIAGGLLLAVTVAVAGWWAYRRWRGEPFLPPVVDNRPPWQVAHDELDRIDGLGLLEKGRFKEHYTLVTDCLRTYLEVQFDLSVFERTTSELKAIFRTSDITPEHARRALSLFAGSDLVKFAKFTPALDIASRLTGQARELVDATCRQSLTSDPSTPDLETFLGQGQIASASASRLSYQSGQ